MIAHPWSAWIPALLALVMIGSALYGCRRMWQSPCRYLCLGQVLGGLYVLIVFTVIALQLLETFEATVILGRVGYAILLSLLIAKNIGDCKR